METLNILLAVLGIGFVVWLLYRVIRNQPEAFSRINIEKSLSTLGVLALILIGFIGLFVVLLK